MIYDLGCQRAKREVAKAAEGAEADWTALLNRQWFAVILTVLSSFLGTHKEKRRKSDARADIIHNTRLKDKRHVRGRDGQMEKLVLSHGGKTE